MKIENKDFSPIYKRLCSIMEGLNLSKEEIDQIKKVKYHLENNEENQKSSEEFIKMKSKEKNFYLKLF